MTDDLNELLSQYFYQDTEDPSFTFLDNMSQIILKPRYHLSPQTYQTRMGIFKSCNLSEQFLGSIDKRYQDHFQYMMEDNHITLQRRTRDNVTKLSYTEIGPSEKHIHIYATGTIEDSYTLSHELIHSWNGDYQKLTFAWDLTTEGLSVLTESLQQDYFLRNGYSNRDCRKNKIDTYYALREKALLLAFDVDMAELFQEYGYVDEYLLAGLIRHRKPEDRMLIYEHLEWTLATKTLGILVLPRDVVGGVLASHMHQRILEKPKRIQEFIEINDNCSTMEFNDILRYLDLDIEDEESIILSPKSLEKLRQNYQKEVHSL